ncbi:pyridoxal phosphate-dependent aminotransferase [Flavisphingomonas formosensis]|uniref:pyridoxal phosphate-dependent aminotransferase n=1 Tax=Flavisphingomonas formosensis TaxID=861534 RepID=UPI0012FA3171|nr:pyridoxal phosphate-dependent aminotransferase [Sphingomonas formosensis]
MELPPFLLDHWMAAHEFATPPIAYNLASSTGPRWTIDTLAALGDVPLELASIPLGYAPPDGSRTLREAIGAFYGVDPDWIVVTTGASEGFAILACLAARPGATMLLPDPAFPAFAAVARAWGLGIRSYALSREEGFAQRAGSVLAAADRDTALALINTPHNPTGSVMPANEVRALAQGLAAHGAPLIVDEVYHPLYFGAANPSAAGTPNTVVISDMSKAFSLPGLRLGWIVDADAERRKRMIDARSYFTISSSPLTEAIAAHALRHHAAVLARLAAVATANLTLLDDLMAECGDRVGWVRPQGGTVGFPWFRDGRDARPFCKALARAGVLVAPGDCFGVPSHMRIGFGQQADGYADALAIMGETLKRF